MFIAAFNSTVLACIMLSFWGMINLYVRVDEDSILFWPMMIILCTLVLILVGSVLGMFLAIWLG